MRKYNFQSNFWKKNLFIKFIIDIFAKNHMIKNIFIRAMIQFYKKKIELHGYFTGKTNTNVGV